MDEACSGSLGVARKLLVLSLWVRQGLPMYVWRDGKIVELSPEELRVELRVSKRSDRPNPSTCVNLSFEIRARA